MGNSSSASPSGRTLNQYIAESSPPVVLVTYKPEGYGTFTYSEKHVAYTNYPSTLDAVPGPSATADGTISDGNIGTNSLNDMNKFHVSDAVENIIQGAKVSETSKVRLLWKWLTSQDIHGTVYKLTEDFDLIEYQLKKLKIDGDNGGNTYAALFSLLCSYAKIPCVLIRGYLKGSAYKIGKPFTKVHLSEWNAVFVDGSWRLLDPFWGACAKNQDGEITSDSTDWYLFTEPRHFLYSHFPETPEWQLMDKPISMQEFSSQPYIKERFFALGMQEPVTPSTSMIHAKDAEVNLLLPLDPEKAHKQKFMCITKHLAVDGSWESTGAKKDHNQLEFMYLMKEGEMVTMAIHVRFPDTGTYKLEVVGKENAEAENELNDFDWVILYRVEVNALPNKVIMFPKEQSIGWGPGDRLKSNGLEAVSHQEGMIKLFQEDALLMEFKVRRERRIERIRLRDRLHQMNGELQPPKSVVDDAEWYSKERDGSIKFTVRLKVAAEYMLQICAEVNGKDIGSVCNYLICARDIVDKELEEIKRLKPRLKDAKEKRNLYELRRLTSEIRMKALHRHELMRQLYNEAVELRDSLQKREDILRKLRALNIPNVVNEIRRINQVPDERVEKIMRALLIILGVPEKELKSWEKIRQQIARADTTENLPERIRRLQDNMTDFINERRNAAAIKRVEFLLKHIDPIDMERIALVVVPMLVVLKLIVSEYRAVNPRMFERNSTAMTIDVLLSPSVVDAEDNAGDNIFISNTTKEDMEEIRPVETADTLDEGAHDSTSFDEQGSDFGKKEDNNDEGIGNVAQIHPAETSDTLDEGARDSSPFDEQDPGFGKREDSNGEGIENFEMTPLSPRIET